MHRKPFFPISLIFFLGISLIASADEGVSAETSLSVPQSSELDEIQVLEKGALLGKPVDEKVQQHQLEELVGTSVADVVEAVTGVDNMGGPRRESQAISIRGFSPKQVLYLFDGARQNFRMTHNSVMPVRYHLLQSIDLVKGSASARFGNGAAGGLVSFTTHDAFSWNRFSRSSVQLRTQGASVADHSQNSVTASQRIGKSHGVMFDLTSSHASDVRLSNQEKLSYSGSQDESGWFKYSYRKAGHNLDVSVEAHEKNSETPFDPTSQAFKVSDVALQKERIDAIKLRYDYQKPGLKFAKMNPTLVIYRNQTQMDRERKSDGRFDRRNVDTIGTMVHSKYEKQLGDWRFGVQPGIEYSQDINNGSRDGGALASFPKGQSSTFGSYLLASAQYGRQMFRAGIRRDEFRLDSLGLAGRKETQWSPELEVGRAVTDTSVVSVSYREGFNSPRIQDIYVDGLHFDDGFVVNYFIPNPDLRSEKSRTVQAKAIWDYSDYGAEDFSGQLEWVEYLSEVDNYIDMEYISNPWDPVTQDFPVDNTQFVNRERVNFTGREVSLNNEIARWGLKTGYSQVRAVQDNGSFLASAPADKVHMLLSYRRSLRWSFGINSMWAARQNRIDESSLINIPKTPGYDLQGLFATYSFQQMNGAGLLRFRINNLFDKKYRPHGTPLDGPARDVRVELAYKFL